MGLKETAIDALTKLQTIHTKSGSLIEVISWALTERELGNIKLKVSDSELQKIITAYQVIKQELNVLVEELP